MYLDPPTVPTCKGKPESNESQGTIPESDESQGATTPQPAVPARTDGALWTQLRDLNARFGVWKQKSEAWDKISNASASNPKKEQAAVKKEFVTLRNDFAALKESMKRHREASEVEEGSEIEAAVPPTSIPVAPPRSRGDVGGCYLGKS